MTENEVRKLLANFCRKSAGGVSNIIVAVIKDVDKNERTCTVLDEDTEYYGVRLQPIINAKSGLVLFPKKDACALVSEIEGGDLAVIFASEYESISLKLEDIELLIVKNGIVANNGDLGGIVKIQELQDNLNALKNYCEALKTAISTGINAVGTSTAASGQAGATAFETAMSGQNISFKNMEDTKFKH